MEVNDYAARSAALGERLKNGLESINNPKIKEVRGRGLLLGMEVSEDVDGKKLTKSFIECGILTKETRSKTFRFAPPLVIEESLVDEIVERTAKALGADC
jgi:ornithine--oxo-acid transaminase